MGISSQYKNRNQKTGDMRLDRHLNVKIDVRFSKNDISRN